jgi:hypothetical protein
MRQWNILGRSDFGGSVGKGKQTKFYFRPKLWEPEFYIEQQI